MSILVTLALADGPMRQINLWKHLDKKAKTALYALAEIGLVATWRLSRKQVYVALDPSHPASVELRRLLLRIADLYLGFRKPVFSADDRDGGDAPVRPHRRRDVQTTFGDARRTLPLLIVYIRKETAGVDIARIVPYVTDFTSRDILWMYQAFGFLTARRGRVNKHHGDLFEFDNRHPLTPFICDVLAALDTAMPQWRIRSENQTVAAAQSRRHTGRRKPKRWKW